MPLMHGVAPPCHRRRILQVALGLGDGHVYGEEDGGCGIVTLEVLVVGLHVRGPSSSAEEVEDVLEWLCGRRLWEGALLQLCDSEFRVSGKCVLWAVVYWVKFVVDAVVVVGRVVR